MPAYKCKIAVSGGEVVEKVITSNSASSLKKTIARDGGFLVHVKKNSYLQQKIKPKEFYSFNQEFLTLLRAGLPVVIAFDTIIAKQDKTSFIKILKNIREDISQGESIANAFEKYETVFSALYIASLRSGEASGNVSDAIEEYLEYFERSQQIRQKIKSASVYPAILTICSVFVVAFLIVFVVPAITGTFVEAGAELPISTSILLGFSAFIRSYLLAIIMGIILMIWGVSFYLKTDKGRLLFDTYYLKLPFLGDLSVIYSTALFASSLSTVLTGGIPLNKALEISKGLIKNMFFQAEIQNVVKSVEQGRGFTQSLNELDIFPDMALRMIAAGEEGGALEKVLKDIARFYEKEVEAKLTIMTSTIEPLLMVLMGFVIGFIMLAMYMPIFQMAGTIG
ncbi:MAG: type II secretion system F family protein [Deltaproteobacteria bacterium]|nr:type II secretion system F family protein [Deltaproteobacteria bacterium]